MNDSNELREDILIILKAIQRSYLPSDPIYKELQKRIDHHEDATKLNSWY